MGHQNGVEFTAEEDAFLMANYHNLSKKQIGERLGRTRNSIIGRARRLGLNKPFDLWLAGRKAQITVARRRPPRPKKPPVPKVMTWTPRAEPKVSPFVVPENGGLTLTELRNGVCRYPFAGEGDATLFCGREAVGSWCPSCRKRVFAGKEATPRLSAEAA